MWLRITALLLMAGLSVSISQGQQATQTGTPTNSQESETSTRDLDTAIKVQVNLVLVRAVVRDATGKVVPDLKREDFKILDNGKPQRISSFTVETETPDQVPTAVAQVEGSVSAKDMNASAGGSAVSPSVIPKRFVMLVFDDLHMKVADAMAVHAATEKLFASVAPTDRVAIYSTDGDVHQDFTDDPAILRKTLKGIVPHSSIDEGHHECPDISYYQADLIENRRDDEAIRVANAEAIVRNCPVDLAATTRRILQDGDLQTDKTYQYLSEVVRKLAVMPGQRVLVYVSPGFLVGQTVVANSWDWIEKAVRAGVVVNTVDARGLYTPEGMGDIDAPPVSAPSKHLENGLLVGDPKDDYQGIQGTYRMETQFEQGQVLASVAANTGGTYFHNRNDLNVGLAQALETPAVSYLLGFTPQSPAADGKFHTLKVEVANGKKYQIQARNGYFARKKLADPEEEAKQEVREALFSNDEIVSLPMQLKTQFLSIDATSTQLTVLTHLDINTIRFRKADGRNRDEVVVATGVFDRNGQLVDGQMKEVSLKLQDTTVKRLSQSGLTFKSVFTVRPGTYYVRSVVRAAEGDQLTAQNVSTVIP